MSTNQSRMNRRTFVKTVGVGAGAAAAGSTQTPLSPIGDADALLGTALLVGGTAVTAAAVGWTAREMEIIGKDDPPEGLTPGALKQQAYQTALSRESTNASTFVDNRNIATYIPETAFSEGKAAAIEAINEGKSQSEVEGAAQSAAASHYATIEKNLLKSWNESVNEYDSMVSTVSSHPDVAYSDVFSLYGEPEITWDGSDTEKTLSSQIDRGHRTVSISLRDGTTMEIERFYDENHYDYPSADASIDLEVAWDPTTTEITQTAKNSVFSVSYSFKSADITVTNPDSSGSNVVYMGDDWLNIWSDIQSQFDQIDSSISTWVSNRYDDVQSGEIDIADLPNATDIAGMSDVPQAVADLIASNLPTDLDNQLTVEMGKETMSGFLATTDQNALSSAGPGDTIDPNATDGDGNPLYGTIFLAEDIAEWRYDWTAYDDSKGVDGGVVWYTRKPTKVGEYDSEIPLLHTIETTAGETVTVPASDFSKTDDGSGNTVWEADLSGLLENTVTDIHSVTVSVDAQSRYTVTELDQTFTVKSTETGDPVNLENSRDPQTDDNYITQQEWDQIREDQEELIERFEDAKDGGVGLPGLGGGLPFPAEWLVAGFVGIAGLAGLNAASG